MNEKLDVQTYQKDPSLLLGIILLISLYLFTYLIVDFVNFLYFHWNAIPKLKNHINLFKLGTNFIINNFDIVFGCVITFYLLKKYRTFLLTDRWKSDFIRYLIVGLKWASPIIFLTVVYLFIPAMRQNQFENDDFFGLFKNNIQELPAATVIFYSANLIVGTILEELIYRGIIQNNLYKFLNRYWCIVISAIFFTLMHVLYYSTFSFINTRCLVRWFLGGLIFSIAFDRRRSCISSIVPHLIFNSWGIVLNPIRFFLLKY